MARLTSMAPSLSHSCRKSSAARFDSFECLARKCDAGSREVASPPASAIWRRTGLRQFLRPAAAAATHFDSLWRLEARGKGRGPGSPRCLFTDKAPPTFCEFFVGVL